jgi:hypothetical protein
MAIPSKRHEDIRNREQDDGFHVFPFSLCLEMRWMRRTSASSRYKPARHFFDVITIQESQ